MYEIGGKKIAETLAELVDTKRSALLIWGMEYAIGSNAFNYTEIIANLKSERDRRDLAAKVKTGIFPQRRPRNSK